MPDLPCHGLSLGLSAFSFSLVTTQPVLENYKNLVFSVFRRDEALVCAGRILVAAVPAQPQTPAGTTKSSRTRGE